MATRFSRFSTGLAAVAVVAMTASPALARGWGHHRHGRNHISTGEVFAGIFVLGTIAAVANAAGKADKARNGDADYRDPPRRQRTRDTGYAEDRQVDNRVGAGGIGSAVNACADEVERADRRISSVDGVVREGEGWRVQGRVGTGKTFACSVSDTGRIRSVTVDGQAAYSGDDDAGDEEG